MGKVGWLGDDRGSRLGRPVGQFCVEVSVNQHSRYGIVVYRWALFGVIRTGLACGGEMVSETEFPYGLVERFGRPLFDVDKVS